MSTPQWKATQGTGDQTLKGKNQHRSLRLADILTTTSKAEAMASNLTEEDSNRVEEVSNKEADSSKTGEFPQRGGFALTRRPFCRTCYDSNKGKDTYLMHATTSPTYPSRQQFSSIDTYPQEVLETGDYMLPGNEVMDDQVWLDWLVDAGWLILTGWYWLVDTGWLILAGWYWLVDTGWVCCTVFTVLSSTVVYSFAGTEGAVLCMFCWFCVLCVLWLLCIFCICMFCVLWMFGIVRSRLRIVLIPYATSNRAYQYYTFIT